jgi:hypothetical protein
MSNEDYPGICFGFSFEDKIVDEEKEDEIIGA